MPFNIKYPKENILPFQTFAAVQKSGDLCFCDPWYGIAENDQEAGTIGPLHVNCIVELPKYPTAPDTYEDISQGDLLTYVAPQGTDTGGTVEVADDVEADYVMAIALTDSGTGAQVVLARLISYPGHLKTA